MWVIALRSCPNPAYAGLMARAVAALLQETDHVLVRFDGPVCPALDATWRRTTAARLRLLLDPRLPREVARTSDPLAVLRYAVSCGAATAHIVETQLRWLELEAVATAEPTEGAADALGRLYAGGATVTAVGAQGAQVIRSYLLLHDLGEIVRRVSARLDATTPLPSDPALLNQVVDGLATTKDRCLFLGTEVDDLTAARAAGVRFVGYAPTPQAVRRLRRHRPQAIIGSMSELDWLPEPRSASARDLLSWRN